MSNEKQPSLKGYPQVIRLLYVPKVLWENSIAPILGAHELPIPKTDFNVYRWMDIKEFVDNAGNAFFTKLTATCLERAGIEINLLDNKTLPVTVVRADKFEQGMQLINSISRHREAQHIYEEREKVIKERIDTSSHGLAIVDTVPVNSNSPEEMKDQLSTEVDA